MGVDLTGTPLREAEDATAEVPASKLRDGHPDPPVRSGAWIDPTIPTLGRATARDGTVVQLRPLRRDERDLVARFFAGLSAESRRRRFLQPTPRPPEATLRRLVEVDGRRHVAVVATVEGQCIGIGRYVAWPASRAWPRSRSRSRSPTATRVAALAGCWSRACGRSPSGPA